MAIFQVTDPQTGRKLRLTGDSPPTEQELEQIFSSQGAVQQAQPLFQTPSPAPAQVSPQQRTMAQRVQEKLDMANAVNQIPTGIAGVTPEKFSIAEPKPEPTMGEQIKGAGEAALTTLTGMTGGALGYLGGTAKGIGEELIGGITGTGPQPGSGYAEEQAAKGAAALTYQPRTEAGKEKVEAIGEAAQQLTPLVPLTAELSAISAPIKFKVNLAKSPEAAFVKAHRLGYKVPPSSAKRSMTQQFMEGTAGPVPTKQMASLHNQKITNSLIKKSVGYPDDVPLSPEGLASIRTQAGQAYEAAKNFGVISVDKQFRTALGKIGKPGSSFHREFPGLVKKDVNNLLRQFRKKEFSSEALVEVSKQLRADANAGYASSDPAIKAMAAAKSKLSNAIDHLIERAAAEKAPNLVSDLKNARTTIAKTYQIEKVLKGENVDAVALGRDLSKGKPMTGSMRDVAEFGQRFKGAAQVEPPQMTGFRPMDVLTGIGSAAATGNATWLAAAGIRPALRKLILSKPYQGLVARMKPQEWEAVLSLPEGQQITAMQFLLQEATQNTTQNNSQQ